MIDILMDLLKKVRENGIGKLTQYINRIYKTRESPKNFFDLTTIPLKKQQAKEYRLQRPINLISCTERL